MTCEPKLIHMLYPEPARTRLTTHGQMICRAHIPQLHTDSKSDGHKETGETRARARTHTQADGGDEKINSKQEDEKQRGGRKESGIKR